MKPLPILDILLEQAEKSKQPRKAIDLYSLMGELSLRCQDAGWLIGNGDNLWDMTKQFEKDGQIASYGSGVVFEDELKLMIELASDCKCWWTWTDGKPECVRLSDWRQI